MKIALGTVQLGLDYGISNRAGQVPADEARRILALAAEGGVRVLDTAAAYGAAEAVLGELLPAGHRFDVVTKLPRVPETLAPAAAGAWARRQLQASLLRLRAESVHGLLMHSAQDLLGPCGDALWQALEALRAEGRVRRIGASVYGAEEIDALERRYRADLVQLPLSVLDQRLLQSGHLARLKARGVEIHARSLFLQGLLLMDPAGLGPHFEPARLTLSAYHAAARALDTTPLALAVAFALAVPEIDAAVVGVTTAAELREILAPARGAQPLAWYAPFALGDAAILNPAKWPKPVPA